MKQSLYRVDETVTVQGGLTLEEKSLAAQRKLRTWLDETVIVQVDDSHETGWMKQSLFRWMTQS